MSFFSNTWINGAARYIDAVSAAVSPYPSGDFSPTGELYYPEPIGGSTALERYQWNMDGQSMFWLRGEEWVATDPVIEITFIGAAPLGTYDLVDNTGAEDRPRVFVNVGTGYIVSGGIIELNGVVVGNNTTAPIVGALNHVKVTRTGVYGVSVFGANTLGQLFYPAAITSVRLTDPASATNSYTYKLAGNAPYELPIGEELGVESLAANRDFSSDGPWQYGGYTHSEVIGEWATTSGGTGPRTSAGSMLGSDFWVLSWGGLVDSEVYINRDGALSLLSSSGDGRLIVSIDGATTTAQIYLRSTVGGPKSMQSFSMRPAPVSRLSRENSEPDGSDIELIARKPDNSGWIGENAWNGVGNFDSGSSTIIAEGVDVGQLFEVSATYSAVGANFNIFSAVGGWTPLVSGGKIIITTTAATVIGRDFNSLVDDAVITVTSVYNYADGAND